MWILVRFYDSYVIAVYEIVFEIINISQFPSITVAIYILLFGHKRLWSSALGQKLASYTVICDFCSCRWFQPVLIKI
jgi:hypothetical protein